MLGKIRVNRFHPRHEAFVTPLSSRIHTDVATEPITKEDILIYGMAHRYIKQLEILCIFDN